jgi:SAM-dependent methyltransferase
MAEQERVNVDVWRSAQVLDIFASRRGALDEGEAAMIGRILGEARGEPILDIGVGGGRTIPLLAPASPGYVAVDYLEEAVELARSAHPGVRVEQADARRLDGFPDLAFAGALFSFNGLDGMAHEDRAAVHRAVMRVLRPGGIFVYSTHNLDYQSAGLPPWHRAWWDTSNGPRAFFSFLARLPGAMRSYRRLRSETVSGDGWAVLVGAGYDFGVLWHHVTAQEAAAEVRRAGWEEPEMFAMSGTPHQPGADTRSTMWFYVLARKPVTVRSRGSSVRPSPVPAPTSRRTA